MESVTLYPQNAAQMNLIVSLAKELKMKFSTTSEEQQVFLLALEDAAKEAKSMAAGEIPSQTLDSFLSEL